MSRSVEKTPKSSRRTAFYRDLASPVSSHRSRFASPAQSPSPWKENLKESPLPPPPAFTLDDRSDFSPEPGLSDWPVSPEPKTPASPAREPAPVSAAWWSSARKSGGIDQEANTSNGSPVHGSPVDGVVLPGALITLPPLREVARPEVRTVSRPVGSVEEDEWVTVYGFPPCDTNLVLREFEKCGLILRHIPGPGDANWMHVLYQNRYDAQKALLKNGMQISGGLIVGVKTVDPAQRALLSEKSNGPGPIGGFMVSLPPSGVAWKGPSQAPPLATTVEGGARQGGGAIASPAKSVVSKIMDLMFGI